MNYKVILFDADGTLFDFDKAELEAFQKTMHKFNVNGEQSYLHREYEKINKAIWQDFQDKKISSLKLRTERFRLLAQKCNLDYDPFEISPIYLQYLAEGIHLLDGAKEIVDFYSKKYELALATNGLSDVQNPRIAASRLAGYFKYIFISEEIGHPKPEPEFFYYIFNKLSHRDQTIIIGDSLSSDIKGGNDAGIDTCWFNPQNITNNTGIIPTFEINHLSELKSIIN